jgi:hypothetical protein
MSIPASAAMELERPQFVVDYDMRNDEIQIYDRKNARIAAIFYRYSTGLAHIAQHACNALNEQAQEPTEPRPVGPEEGE